MPNPLGPIEAAANVLKFVARESDRAITTQVGELLASPAGANTVARAAEIVQLPIAPKKALLSGASDLPSVNAIKQATESGGQLSDKHALDGILKALADPKSELVLELGRRGLFGSSRAELKIAWSTEAPRSLNSAARPVLSSVDKPVARSFEQIFQSPRTPLQQHLNSVYGQVIAAVDDAMVMRAIRMGIEPSKAREVPLFRKIKAEEIIDI